MPEGDPIPLRVHRDDETEDVIAVGGDMEYVQENYDRALAIARDRLDPGEEGLDIRSDNGGRKVIFTNPGRLRDADSDTTITKEPIDLDDKD